jgi:hypothetical protein
MRAAMSGFPSICSLVLLAACGGESDVEMYVVMPNVEAVCTHVDAASVDLHISGPGPEDFSVRGVGCGHQPRYGFDGLFTAENGGPLVVERLDRDFYWVTARVFGTGDEFRGERVQPFDAREPRIAVLFDRADLPGWPMGEIDVVIPACELEDGLDAVRVTIKPVGAHVPDVTLVSCRDAHLRMPAPLGPVEITGEGFFHDGSVCFKGSATAVVAASTQAELPLRRSCRR